jgi:hypothetical protein
MKMERSGILITFQPPFGVFGVLRNEVEVSKSGTEDPIGF